MAKIAQVSAKYIIHTNINIDGVVDKPDVVGAIFGQTEGLLGADLELRELQRSGRIGRIEVNIETKSGKTRGIIIIPSSLDKAETCIVAAALETIERIGPCNARVKVDSIEDVRVAKRKFVVERAKDLLKGMLDKIMPDSQEMADEVAASVRMMEITEYGRERLPAGPAIEESDEVIVVEGRADVLNLLKHGFKNVIALNGTSVPTTIKDLSKRKTMTAFVDGDRGGDLIIRELFSVAEIDFVCKAPAGKEVEELTKKEIHKSLRAKVAAEQVKLEQAEKPQSRYKEREKRTDRHIELSNTTKQKFSSMVEDLIGTRGAYLLDEKFDILGKIPITELQSTLKSLGSVVKAVVMDGTITKDIVSVGERSGVRFIIGMNTKAKSGSNCKVLTIDDIS